MKKTMMTLLLSMALVITLSPTAAYAKEYPHPVCEHGYIGCRDKTTMYNMGRVTTGRDPYGNVVQIVWYRCFVCGYEVGIY